MKTEIIAKDYIGIYEACDWNSVLFEKVLRKMGYDFGNLTANGNIHLYDDQPLTHLVGIKTIEGCLIGCCSPLESFGNLQIITKCLDIPQTDNIKSLNKITKIESYVNINSTNIIDFGNLKYVGSYLMFEETPIGDKISKELSTISNFSDYYNMDSLKNGFSRLTNHTIYVKGNIYF